MRFVPYKLVKRNAPHEDAGGAQRPPSRAEKRAQQRRERAQGPLTPVPGLLAGLPGGWARPWRYSQVAALYTQHTADTGQAFNPGAIDLVLALSAGQLWLINALAREMVEELLPDRRVMLRARARLPSRDGPPA